MRLGFGMLLAAALLAAPLSPASADDAPALPPKPDFSSMQFLLGTWTCQEKDPIHPVYTTQMTWSLDPSGYLLISDEKRAAQSWYPGEKNTRMTISYDSERKQWGLVSISDRGDLDSAVSDGWSDNVMTWHYFNAPPMIVSAPDLKLTKVSETHFTTGLDVTLKGGQTFSDTSDCTKS